MIAGDAELDPGACVGTLRWRAGKAFPSVAALAGAAQRAGAQRASLAALRGAAGWAAFLRERCGGPDAVARCQQDLAAIDGLSFPVTALHALDCLGLGRDSTPPRLDIVVLGATYKAELRLLNETQYWAEIQHHYGQATTIHLWFVGPELHGPPAAHAREDSPRTLRGHANLFEGTALSFLRDERPALAKPRPGAQTVIFAFNPGFGSGSEPLLRSWLPDLRFILDSDLPAVFTQANDYSDLRGELTVLRSLLQANFLMAPKRNPFHMALTACADPAQPTASTWSCGNSFIYALRGSRATPGQQLDSRRISVCAALLARFHADTSPFAPSDAALRKNELATFSPSAWSLPESNASDSAKHVHDEEIKEHEDDSTAAPRADDLDDPMHATSAVPAHAPGHSNTDLWGLD